MRGSLVVLALAVALAGCNRSESGGPGEKAGRAVDQAMDKAGKSVEQAGRDLQDASKGKK